MNSFTSFIIYTIDILFIKEYKTYGFNLHLGWHLAILKFVMAGTWSLASFYAMIQISDSTHTRNNTFESIALYDSHLS